MKTLETIKVSLRKIGKGLLAIFVIKLIFFGGFFIVQSCQTESVNSEFNNIAKENFLASLQKTEENLNSVQTKINLKTTLKTNTTKTTSSEVGETTVVCLIDPPKDEEITGFGKLLQVAIDWDLVIDEVDNGDPSIDCYVVLVQDVQQALNPGVENAKNYFRNQFGFTDDDIVEMLDGEDENLLIPYVIQILALQENEGYVASFENELFSLFGQTAFAINQNSSVGNAIWDCTMEAIGVSALLETFSAIQAGNKYLLKKAGVKALKKLAKRFLGPIGIAIAVVDFAFCMNRYYNETSD